MNTDKTQMNPARQSRNPKTRVHELFVPSVQFSLQADLRGLKPELRTSVSYAIKLSTTTMRNAQSSRVSVPAMFVAWL
ncbi:MAG: hypothetical protein DMG09_11635 [Acidobacteria bacterium]|nr:MAG: hypothetical protein DMG09_11635 [Acidobacteriota bacterium]